MFSKYIAYTLILILLISATLVLQLHYKMNTIPYIISATCTLSFITLYDYFNKTKGMLYYNIKNPKNEEIINACPDIKNKHFYPTFFFHSELL